MNSSFGRQALVLAFFLFVLLMPTVVSAESDQSGENIERFDVDIRVGESDEIEVTETIRYHFGEVQKHGIYRDIPFKYVTTKGTARTLPIDVRSVTNDSGGALHFVASRTDGYLRVKVGDPDHLISGIETYVLRYTVRGAISFFDDYDELYWNVTGNAWTVPIFESTVTIRLSQIVSNARLACYIGPVGSTERCLADQISETSRQSEFRASAGQLLPAGSGMTVALGIPKGIVREPTLATDTFRFLRDNPFVPLPLIVFAYMYRLWKREGRDPKGRGVIIPEYDVPEGLSLLYMAALMDGRLTGKEIPAAIIDLAVKGYLVIERVTEDGLIFDTTDYRLVETAQHPIPSSIEAELIDALFSGNPSAAGIENMRKLLASSSAQFLPGFLKRTIEARIPKTDPAQKTTLRSVKVSELKNKFYLQIPTLEKRAMADLVARKLLAASPQDVWGKYTLWGILCIFGGFFLIPLFELQGASIVALVVSALIYFVFVYLMPRVTSEGAVVKEQLLGLKEYLQIAEKRRLEFHNAPEKTPELFERLLPAALLLGVSDIWAKEFADISMSEPAWFQGGSASTFSATSFASDLGGFNTTVGTTLATAPSGSGSGGGGSSGGGGGGGGGGSW